MTPIEKNGQASSEHIAPIRVEDESGQTLSPTYPRRAKGLVKSGRAVWTDETQTAICLLSEKTTSVREKITEEMIMNNENRIETAETPENRNTIEYILQKMEELSGDPEYISQAIDAISNMDMDDGAAAEKTSSLSEIIKCRETTNQHILQVYDTMYCTLMKERIINSSAYADSVIRVLETIKDMDFDSNEGRQLFLDRALNALEI